MDHNSQCVLFILRLKSIAAALLNFHCSFSHELSALRKWSVLRIDILHDHRLTFNIQWGPLNAIQFFVWRKFNEEKFRYYYFSIHMERSQETLQPGIMPMLLMSFSRNLRCIIFPPLSYVYFGKLECVKPEITTHWSMLQIMAHLSYQMGRINKKKARLFDDLLWLL